MVLNRKTRKIFFALTLILTAAGLLAGCGNDQYALEKKYWHLQKRAEKIAKNPESSPANELENLLKALDNFIQKYPKNNLAVGAEFTIARLYIVKKEYGRARSYLKAVLNKHNEHKDVCSEALFLMGYSYEIEDRWDSALEEYKTIMQEYPVTAQGISIPFYIAQHYKIKHQPDKMITSYREAADHYKSLAVKYPDSRLAYETSYRAARCYMEIKDWQSAVNLLGGMIEAYKGKANLEGVLMDMVFIYGNELKDRANAKKIMERLLKDYPQSRFIKIAPRILEEKDKNEGPHNAAGY